MHHHQQQQQQQDELQQYQHLRRPRQQKLQSKQQQQQQQQHINILRRMIEMNNKGAEKKKTYRDIMLKKKMKTMRIMKSSPSLRWIKNRILLLIVVLLLPPPFGVIYLCSSSADSNDDDRPTEKSLLIELFEATRGDLWKNNDNWKTNQPICSWYGVSCDDGMTNNDNEGITRLDLSSNNLNGKIPSMLWQLPKLNHVNLRSNLLTGIGLEGLQTIDPINDPRSPIEMLVLSENHLTTIDDEGIGYARETLVNLNLNKNQLSTLPTSVWELTNLETLYVAFNQISGTIPTLIGRLSKLTEFYAFDNRYTGQLPSELGLLDSCEIFGLGNNFITGTLPTDMNQMANIHDLSIHHVDYSSNNNNGPRQSGNNNNNNSNNNNDQQSQQFAGITGPLLTFGDMPFLSLLFLDGNSLTGTIPSDFLRHNSNTGQPVTVGLMNNQLSGTIPGALERFDALSIDLVGNTIIEIPTELCSKGGWMGGLVEEHQCDAILCRLGTYNTDGRATGDDNPCLPCDDDTTQYLGSTFCFSSSSGSTTTTNNNSMIWQILQSFYRTLGGDKWTDKTGWDIFDGRDNNNVGGGTNDDDDDTSYCDSTWFGIDCDDSNSIIGISLPQNELFGTVPDTIFDISTLRVLDISNNDVVLLNLEGAATAAGGGDSSDNNNNNLHTLILSNIKMDSISGLEQLTNLEHLYLDGQTFATELPDDLYKLTNLRALHLQHGQFHGTVPSQIGMLSDLTLLNMYGNELSGQLPSELGLLTRLLSLDLSENQFEGTLPTEMDQMTNLAIIAIHQTGGRLNGQIPAFDSYPNLKELNLESNMFEGQLPDNFLAGVADKTTAITVSLGYNQLTGSVPTSLTEFRLLNLKLEGNQISSLPQTLCDPLHNGWMDGEVGRLVETMKCDAILCPPLTWNNNGKATNTSVCKDCPENDSLYGQTLCSSAPENRERQILDKLFAMTGGRYWSRSHDNWLRPGVPICQREQVHCFDSNADEGVREILLNGFGLRGTIPSEIWELNSARELAFTNNAVDVSFQGIEKATALQTLKLSHCHLRSLEGLGKATSRLTELHIAFNQFNGTIPEQLFSLDNLDRLFLNNNHFSSRIPSDIQKMTALVTLELQDNKLTGSLPSELGLLANLQTLQVQQNDLSGVIPSDLQSLQSLAILDISNQIGKKFQGAFPPFPSSPLLTTIDASRNAFSGGLPSDFLSGVDPTAALTVDLSMNHFEGTVPEEWSKFETMEIDISGNMLTSLPEALCGNVGWNDGMVGILGSCNAILCPIGFAQPAGRQTDAAHPCQACPGGVESARFLGSRECLDPDIVEQANILTTFYTATNGTDWLSQTNWLSSDPVCVWFGIKCNEDGNVVEIHLGNNLLKGDSSSVSSIFALPELKVLDLKNNDITLDYRSIPLESKLEFLRMSGTGLSSLTGIARATRLKELHATNNDLVYLSNEIFDMVSLEALFLSFNGIEGTMSRNIGRLSNLRQFYVYGNRLTGMLPSELGQMSSLVEFVAASNFLSGVLPTEISELPNLEQFTVANQQGLELITGPIPTFAGATKLWYFDASNNDLTGPVPQNFMVNSEHKSEAVTVYMTNNEITGTIPSRLSEFDRLDIDLVGNKIVEIPNALCHLDNWMEGNVKEVGNCNAILCPQGTFNQFGKESPGNPCSPCPHLEDVAFLGRSRCEDFTSERDTLIRFFDATGGEFWNSSRSWKSEAPICSWGGILCEDGDLQDTKGITSITLEKNGLSGTLPSDVWTLPSLRRMQVDDNPNLVVNFNGISNAADTFLVASMSRVKMSSLAGISAATSLRELHVAGNNIQGTFPNELFALSDTLEALYIEHNLFYGSLPTRLGEMTELQAFFAFGNDFLSTLPTELGRLKNLRTLVLSENLLYGQIPHELSQMPNLQVLSIFRQEKSGPRLFGTLPTMDKLPQLIELFLQGNEIKGSVPSVFLSASRSVQKIDLSSNLLTGEVPSDLLISSLTLLLADNYIEGFPTPFCEAEDWMDGNVASFGCDAFLCPPGTASSIGRTIDESTRCQNCTKSGVAPFHGSTTCDGPTEREILMNFYYAVGGVFWYRNDFWGSTADICNWYGIGCTGGRVVMINLRANNLRGRPGPDLFNLRDLQILWLYSNPITFSFENIGNAAKLQDLRLDSTMLNSLHGIGSASSLISFDGRFAPIKGQFPEEILQLTNLRTLALGNNELSGSLPTSFSKLRYLVQFSANSNRLTGRLPAFADLPFLRYIDVSHNQLTGPISRKFLDNIPATASPRIKVSQNQLTGVIPEEFDRFREMELYAADNEILGMPLILCDNDDWNGGDVGAYGCDAILCKPGSFSRFGRNTPEERCRRCLTAYHYGATTCDDRSASYRLNPLSSAMIVTLLAGLFFF